jgi:hypothetical protein
LDGGGLPAADLGRRRTPGGGSWTEGHDPLDGGGNEPWPKSMSTRQGLRTPGGRGKKIVAMQQPRRNGSGDEVLREIRGERTLILIFTSVYHVINSIYIYLKIKDLNIYMYRIREYTKNYLNKYNNKKTNTYLILYTNHQTPVNIIN